MGKTGKSICERCKKEFKWSRGNKQISPKFCSLRCYYPERTKEVLYRILEKSFEGHVIKKRGCWDWCGSFDRDGYGQISCCRELRICKAHRASWIIHRGEIPEGLNVLHKCDNRKCTNPDHLFLGTAFENSRDIVYKDRQLKGSKNAAAKLKEEEAIDIKRALKEGVSGAYLSRKYGVSKTIISRIKLGKTWKHIEEK